MKKSTASKKTKTKSPLPSAAADQDIVGLLTTLVEKLTSFEAKIDTVLSRIPSSQPSAAPSPKPPPIPVNEHHKRPRPMYQVVCSDCGKDSSVPFKPSGDRPVYCKECFTIRKRKSNTINTVEAKPKQQAQSEVKPPEGPKAVKTAKKNKAAKKKVTRKNKKPAKRSKK